LRSREGKRGGALTICFADRLVLVDPVKERIESTERRTKVDFAHLLKRVVDDDDPKAEGAGGVR
jgi:hypothetical protein